MPYSICFGDKGQKFSRKSGFFLGGEGGGKERGGMKGESLLKVCGEQIGGVWGLPPYTYLYNSYIYFLLLLIFPSLFVWEMVTYNTAIGLSLKKKIFFFLRYAEI